MDHRQDIDLSYQAPQEAMMPRCLSHLELIQELAISPRRMGAEGTQQQLAFYQDYSSTSSALGR